MSVDYALGGKIQSSTRCLLFGRFGWFLLWELQRSNKKVNTNNILCIFSCLKELS